MLFSLKSEKFFTDNYWFKYHERDTTRLLKKITKRGNQTDKGNSVLTELNLKSIN